MRARSILIRSSLEIAVAAAAERTSRLIRQGKKLLEGGAFNSYHLAELASAIATVDLAAGRGKSARKLFARSLVDPTENSVAQGEWASRRLAGVHVEESNLEKPFTFEARAYNYGSGGEWKKAVEESRNWLRDQPFSSRPAVLGSYLASVILEDYETSIWFATSGLRANPRDFLLLNNLAFAQAQSNNVTDAEKALSGAENAQSDETDEVVFTATAGLVAYRAGDAVRGQLLYKDAIDKAHRKKHKRLESMALVFWALEEIRARTMDADYAQRAALDHIANLPEHESKPLKARLSNYSQT